jgi:hypothetical protein
MKLFDATFCDPNNVSLLSRCRIGLNQTNTAPQVVINNDFKDLSTLLQNNGNNNPPMAARSHLPQQQLNVPRSICAALVPKMKLEDFCDWFDLLVIILQKLNILKVTGPHALHFVSDAQLVGIGGMDIGELADVRDAQERWTLGKGQDD